MDFVINVAVLSHSIIFRSSFIKLSIHVVNTSEFAG
jgi:hypothetical protein